MPNNELILENLLIFDFKGPMAHFRKYYTNSSSLSYLIPPKTVVIGLIAGLLGLPNERNAKNSDDTYYEILNSEVCSVAVSLRSKVNRMMQTINYNFTKTEGKKILFNKPTQIPLEILIPRDCDEIVYRIYFHHQDKKIYGLLKERLQMKEYVYPPYMGLTEFLASIDYIAESRISKSSSRKVEINTVCKLNEVQLEFIDDNLQYITENMPTGFLSDRTPKKPEEYVLEVKGNVMRVNLKDDVICWSVTYPEKDSNLTENILFM
ncbi:CRISPR-associated protein Cas5 [Methanolobus psychrotolerans]|uniref:CRISPR-associated protein Cas5 n=1 Tax=Methanolobus psychrotolerans TaxID=1874706 RepID=UPI000B91A9C0|nr:CRISPR-associated protein Cas5 [Methanolobus psychrotolerans]